MIIDTIDAFVALIPTAAGSDLATLSPFMDDAEEWAKTALLGESLFTAISALADSDELNTLTKLLAQKAYSLAIPFVDLIQTPNGFAVASNTNLSPASQNRVDRLVNNTLQRVNYLINVLISQIEENSALLNAWAAFSDFNQMTETFFWKPSDFSVYPFMPAQNWNAFISNLPSINGFQNGLITERISPEYVAELIQKRRSGLLTDDDKIALHTCQIAICQLISGAQMQAEKQLTVLINHMEANQANYATYIASSAYQIKMSGPYVNDQEDRTFFFNGI